MNLYQTKTKFNCGIDLHSQNMYLCVMDKEGNKLVHKNIKVGERVKFQEMLSPYKNDLTVACESTFNWYVLSDLCEETGIPFVLGHAFYMKAIHDAKVKNDKIDSATIATLLRSNMLPTGYVCRRETRSIRDLLRRRQYFVRERAALEAHLSMTNYMHNMTESRKELKRKKNRLENYFEKLPPDIGVKMSTQADIYMIEQYDKVIKGVETTVLAHAKKFDNELLELLQTIPGLGKIIGLGILYEVDDFSRFADCKHFVSYCRLVTPTHESGGKIVGKGNSNNGNSCLKLLFSELNATSRSHNPEMNALAQRLVKKHGRRKGTCIYCHKLGRAVYKVATERIPFNMEKFMGGPLKKS